MPICLMIHHPVLAPVIEEQIREMVEGTFLPQDKHHEADLLITDQEVPSVGAWGHQRRVLFVRCCYEHMIPNVIIEIRDHNKSIDPDAFKIMDLVEEPLDDHIPWIQQFA